MAAVPRWQGLSLTSTDGLYHSGGIVGSEPTTMRYVHPAYFDDAPRFHSGDIAGDGVPSSRARERACSRQARWPQWGSAGSMSWLMSTMPRTGGGSQSARTDANGNVQVDIILKKMMDSTVGESLAAGAGQRVLKNACGVEPFMGSEMMRAWLIRPGASGNPVARRTGLTR
ncbi:hypothetical protein AAE026_29410 [Bradyrhizobium sp. DN5]|uniref:hypothetical protein n=1 Tax=Bradyrhizobium sp. DN5 TaxID=3056950 RepID=UPI00352393A5